MSIPVKYRIIDNEAIDVEPKAVRVVGFLRENAKEAVPALFPGASKIFLLVEDYWWPLEAVPSDRSLEDAKFLVVIPPSTSGAAPQVSSSGGGPIEPMVPMPLIKEIMDQVSTRFEGMCDTLVTRIARQQGLFLKLSASTASTTKVLELLHRIRVDQSQDRIIPCCTPEADLPQVPTRLTKYSWQGSEASEVEVEKGHRWLTRYICPSGAVVIPVQDQAWLNADFHEEGARIIASKTDFLFAVDNSEVQALMGTKPTPEQLIGILRYVIGAYETKTSTFVRDRGLLGVWPQAVLEALAINYMANRGNNVYFIPVFGGDLNQHLVVHAMPTESRFVLHAAKQAQPDSSRLAIRYMKYLLEQTKKAVEASLQAAGGAGPSDETAQVSVPRYWLTHRGAERHQDPEEASGDPQEEDGPPDEDEIMQAAENAYHLDLIELLRQPRMYRALGLSGPPHRISHASLEERMHNMQVVL